MKKITINKSDEVAIIVEKIIEAPENEVVLNVPRFSHIGESLSNFHLLKREADALEKKIIIESVDDHVIELAEMSGLRAINPFFTKNKRQFSDIVAPKIVRGKGLKLTARVFQSGPEEGMEKQLDSRFEELESDLSRSFRKPKDGGIFRRLRLSLPRISWPSWSFPKIKINHRLALWALIIAAGGGIAVMAVKVLPKATVVIAAKTAEWSYKDSVTTQTSGIFDPVKMTIPNQVFSQKKNTDLRFSATGRRQVEKKSSGVITVYNNYSSDPQPLVVNTRFTSPDGKTFKLITGITVPGAKIIEGNKIPSSIDAEVVADQPGPEYNIGPVKIFNIPGFGKGSAKYNNFYGESTGSMAGGFIGEVAYPTGEDIKNAKTKALSTLEENIKTTLFSQIPPEFKILDGASSFKLLQQKVNEEADQNGNFSVFTEAQLTIIGFKETDVKELLTRRARKDLDNEAYKIRSFDLSYGLPRGDFEKGILSFPVDFKGVFAYDIDVTGLAERLAGKSKSDSRAVILGLSGLDTATVSFWPFWVQTAPNSHDKIQIMVE